MKLTLENTSQLVHINDVPARVWLGRTESGVEVEVLITRIAVRHGRDTAQFERELHETPAPAHVSEAFPLRMVL